MPELVRSIEIKAPLEAVFAFVTDIRNHSRVSPPETREEVLHAGNAPMRLGTVVRLRARYGGISWVLASRVTAFDPPSVQHRGTAYFRDEQVQGPFAVWQHDHWFASTDDGATLLTDRFIYAAPLGPLGRLAERVWLDRRLRRLMEHMQAAEKAIIEAEYLGIGLSSSSTSGS